MRGKSLVLVYDGEKDFERSFKRFGQFVLELWIGTLLGVQLA